jgi:AraC-like DNA-binding protein
MPKLRLYKLDRRKKTPPHSPARQKALRAKRDAWVRQIDPDYLFYRLFDLIPGTYFFAKNREGVLMFINPAHQRYLELFGGPADILGFTDFDLHSPGMAQSYLDDDAHIYATGEPLLSRVELWVDALGLPAWFLVRKMPIFSRTGKIIGIMGFLQSYEDRAKLLPPGDGIAKVVAHIRQNYEQDISIHQMARLSGLSQRQLERRFKDDFGVTPEQFLIKTRLTAACDQLFKTDRGLAEIAQACGFTDQSAFGRTFRLYLGVTPTQFRRSRRIP